MIIHKFDDISFGDIVDEIFSLKDREKSLALIEQHSTFWTQMKAGQGFSGKRSINATTMFDQLFSFEGSNNIDDEEVIEDSDDAMSEVIE
jgi:hypothetical protein